MSDIEIRARGRHSQSKPVTLIAVDGQKTTGFVMHKQDLNLGISVYNFTKTGETV